MNNQIVNYSNQTKASIDIKKRYFNIDIKHQSDVVNIYNSGQFLGDKSMLAQSFALFVYYDKKLFKDSNTTFEKFATEVLKCGKSKAFNMRKVGSCVNGNTLEDIFEKPLITLNKGLTTEKQVEQPSLNYSQILVLIEKLSIEKINTLFSDYTINSMMTVEELKAIAEEYKKRSKLENTNESESESTSESTSESESESTSESTNKNKVTLDKEILKHIKNSKLYKDITNYIQLYIAKDMQILTSECDYIILIDMLQQDLKNK